MTNSRSFVHGGSSDANNSLEPRDIIEFVINKRSLLSNLFPADAKRADENFRFSYLPETLVRGSRLTGFKV